MYNFKKYIGLGVAMFFIAFGALFIYQNTTESSTLDNVSGYAWGADEVSGVPGGIGWISFNCTTGGNCDTSNYGVNIDEATGYISGYAWSSNFGWLKFGGLSNFPAPNPIYGNTSDNAKVEDFGTGEITGWARFCSAAANPSTCSGEQINTSNGGWDGWLALSGTDGVGGDYGLTLESDGVISGYAWGGGDDTYGNPNMTGPGWVAFSGDLFEVVYQEPGAPVVDLEADQTVVPVGGTVTLSWSGTGLINDLEGCDSTGGWNDGPSDNDGWEGLRNSPVGDYTTTTLDEAGTYYYSIACLGTDGVTWSEIDTVEVQVGINLNLWSVPSSAYPADWEVELRWATIPAGQALTSCVASTPSSGTGWGGSVADPGTPYSSQSGVFVPEFPDPTEFILTCEDINSNPVVDNVFVSRAPAEDWVNLTNSEVTGNVSGVSGLVDLEWTSQYMVDGTCEGTDDADVVVPSFGATGWGGPAVGGGGLVLGTGANEGVQTDVLVPVTNDIDICATYTITCDSEVSGTESSSVCLNEFSPAGSIRPKIQEE